MFWYLKLTFISRLRATGGICSSEDNSKGPGNWDQIKLPRLRPSLYWHLQMDLAAAPNSYDNTSSVKGPNDGKHIQLGRDHKSMQGNGIQIWRLLKRSVQEGLIDMMTIWNSFGDLLFNLP